MRSNTATRYGSIAKTLHWLTALLILTLIPLGMVAVRLPFETDAELARKALLFSVHKTLGVTVFAVALVRIAWALTQVRPGPIHPERRTETFLASLVHWLLYGSLVLVPLSGWVHHAATEGFAPIWWPFGQNLPFVPENERVAEVSAALHVIFERVLLGAILLHVAGVLKHALIDRDGTLARMWFGAREAGSVAAHRSGPAAPLVAIGVWGAALSIGAGLGLFAHDGAQAGSAPLAAVASEWQVQDGQLGIAVTQLGSTVQGSFSDWTAAIRFDPDTGTGEVEVTVAIPSLTLGSVTGQALGADYLDATGHPVATFTASIERAGDGYVATGPLTIRGATTAATLPFDLTLADDTATMTGNLTLDRRDFGVGLAMGEANLGFPVEVAVSLTATR